MSNLGHKCGSMGLLSAMIQSGPSSPLEGGFADSPGDTSYTYSESHHDTTSDEILPSNGEGLHECCSHGDDTTNNDWDASAVSTCRV
jgi:hypothetical protein